MSTGVFLSARSHSPQAPSGGTLFGLQARTATVQSDEQITPAGASGIIVHYRITAVPGGGETVILQFQPKDPLSGLFSNLSNTGAIGTAASRSFSLSALPATWRLEVFHSASGSWTYSVSYEYTF